MFTICIDDIPVACRTSKYVRDVHGVSRTSAWRLLYGKVDHLCVGYHDPSYIISDNGWALVMQDDVINHLQKCATYQLYKWGYSFRPYLEDVIQECYIRAYNKSGVWSNMAWPKQRAYLATLAKRTVNDYLKKYVCYTDHYKNEMFKYYDDKAI